MEAYAQSEGLTRFLGAFGRRGSRTSGRGGRGEGVAGFFVSERSAVSYQLSAISQQPANGLFWILGRRRLGEGVAGLSINELSAVSYPAMS